MAKKKASKKKATKKDVGGRPRKEIDLSLLQGLVEIQCTAEECAGVLGVSEDTIDRRLKEVGHGGFAEFYKKNSGVGKTSLRRAQWRLAIEEGNPTMLVWLGKQVLGQVDKQELDHGAKQSMKDVFEAISKGANVLDLARSRK